MITIKRVETKVEALDMESYGSDDLHLDEKQVAFITKNLKNFYKEDNMNGISSRY